MSKEVDERVVRMEFDNKAFESGVKTTMATLQALNKVLQFVPGVKGLDKIQDNIKRFDVSRMISGVESLQQRFSTLGIVGMTVIQNLTNGIIGFGRSLVNKAISGGITRAMNIEKSNFMLKGLIKSETKYKEIMDAVDESVTDTAYSLDQASLVAAQFAAAGIDDGKQMLKTLKGVTGVASVFGADYQRVGQIFTQVAGQGRLMGNDLLSLSSLGVNAAATLAKYYKEVRHEGGKTEADIRDMVSKSKIDFETFSEAMSWAFGDQAKEANRTFTGAMSNVNAALSRIGADFVTPFVKTKEAEEKAGEATYNLIDILNTFRGVLNRIKNILVDKNVYGKFADSVNHASEIVTKFLDILSGDTVDKKGNVVTSTMTKFLRFRKVIGMSMKDFKNFEDTFQGLFSAFRIAKRIVSSFLTSVSPIGKLVRSIGSALLSVTGAIGRFIQLIDKATEETKIFSKIGNGLAFVLDKIVTVLSYFTDGISEIASGLLKGKDGLSGFTDWLGKFAGKTKGIKSLFVSVFSTITNAIGSFVNALVNIFKGGDISNATKVFNTIFTGIVAGSIKEFLDSLSGTLGAAASIKDGIVDLLNSVKGCFEGIQTSLKAKSLIAIASAIAIFAVSLSVLASINPDRMTNALFGLSVLLGELYAMMFMITKLDLKKFGKFSAMAPAMITVAIAVGILAVAAKMLAGLSPEEIVTGLSGLAAILAEISGFLYVVKKTKVKLSPKTAYGVLVISAAIIVMAKAVQMLGSLNANEISQGLVGLGIIFGELAAFMYLTKKVKVSKRSAVGILILSAALIVISEAVKRMSNLNPEQLARGLTGLGFILLEIAGFMKLISGSKGLLLKSVGILVLAKAIDELSGSLSFLGDLSEEQIAKGLVALGGALLSIAISLRAMPWDSLAKAVGLIIVSEAISKLADSLDQFGSMSNDSVAKSLGVLASSLIMIAAAMHAMTGAFRGAASMAVMAVALSILTPVLVTLGNLSLEQIGKALLAIAGAFTVLGIAAAVLSPLIGPMLLLSLAITAIGVAVLAAGAGLLFFVTGLRALADNAPEILQAVPDMVNVIKEFIIQLQSLIPDIVTAGMKVVVAFLKGIKENAPQIIELAGDIIVLFLQGLTKKIPEIVAAAFDFIGEFVKAVIQAIDKFSGTIKEGAKGISAETFKIISDALLELSAAAFILSHINIMGAISGVAALAIFVNGLGLLLTELGALNKIPGYKEFIQSGGELLGAIANGLGEMVGGFIGGIGEGVTNSLPNMALNLSQFMTNLQPFLLGAKMVDKNVASSISNITGAVLALSKAKLNDAVSSFLGGGINFADFGDQISHFIDVFVDFSEKAKEIPKDSLQTIKVISQAVKALAEAAASIPNSGGVVGWWSGENNLGDFAEQLAPFADSFSNLADKAKEISKGSLEKVKIISEAAKTVIEMASSIPNSGGVVGWWSGENDLGSFAKELSSFGTEFVNLASTVSDISEDSINKAALVGKAAKTLAEAAAAMPVEETGWFKTKKNLGLGEFAEQLAPFVTKFKAIQPLLEDIKIKTIQKISKIAASIAKIASIALDDKGIKSFKSLSEHLPILGDNLANYANNVKDVNAEQLTLVNKSLPSLFKSFSKIGEGSGKNLSEIASQLANFGKGLKSYYNSIKDINAEDIAATTKEIASSFKSLSKTVSSQNNSKGFKSAGKNATDAIASGFSSKSLSKGLSSSLSEALKSVKTEAFSKKGKACAKEFSDGFKSANLNKIVSKMMDGLKDNMKSDSFFTLGQNVSQGYANGVLNKAGTVYNAVRSVVKKAYQEGKKAQESNSPSKLYARMGEWVPEGYANGVLAASNVVSKAVKTMVESGVDSANMFTPELSSLLNFDSISDPVIRPVLDLSNVKMGANQINSMFGHNQYALGLAGSLNGTSLSSRPININTNLTVNGADDPKDWADRFMEEVTNELEVQARME